MQRAPASVMDFAEPEPVIAEKYRMVWTWGEKGENVCRIPLTYNGYMI